MTYAVVDKETIKKISHLARVRVNDRESEKYAEDISKVLDWLNMLDEVDVSGVSPFTLREGRVTPFRVDVVSDGGFAELVVQNAKDSKHSMFSVPKVVE